MIPWRRYLTRDASRAGRSTPLGPARQAAPTDQDRGGRAGRPARRSPGLLEALNAALDLAEFSLVEFGAEPEAVRYAVEGKPADKAFAMVPVTHGSDGASHRR